MLGAICGDIVGSPWEGGKCAPGKFTLFGQNCILTDDSICTVAVADAFLNKTDLATTVKSYVKKYPNMGYGGSFIDWAHSCKPAYNSFSNGGAMRVSSLGWMFSSLKETLDAAAQSAEITHNHPEGIKGAQAVAAAIYLARSGHSADHIKSYLSQQFGYKLSTAVQYFIDEPFGFTTHAEETVPVALICVLSSKSWPECMKLCAYCGGDTDTISAMAGGIAEALHGLPGFAAKKGILHLDEFLLKTVFEFYARHNMARPWEDSQTEQDFSVHLKDNYPTYTCFDQGEHSSIFVSFLKRFWR